MSSAFDSVIVGTFFVIVEDFHPFSNLDTIYVTSWLISLHTVADQYAGVEDENEKCGLESIQGDKGEAYHKSGAGIRPEGRRRALFGALLWVDGEFVELQPTELFYLKTLWM